jgi:tRNA pseudouridine38-40 synthase
METGPPRVGVLVEIAYEGTGFSGWASQRHARTVEETLRAAIHTLDPTARGPRGTSRTDAGVHAEQQVAAFDTTMAIPARGWVLALNRHLPDDVAVRAALQVPGGFAPRFASKKKRYRYDLLFDKVRDPLHSRRRWRIGYDMDMGRLQREARSIVGTHDFAAFRSAGDARVETVRTIHNVDVMKIGPVLSSSEQGRLWSIAIEGSGFLYNMVRILVGTLVDVGRGHLEEGAIERAMHAKERRLAGQTAPAHGLTLEAIDLTLPEGCGDRWPR